MLKKISFRDKLWFFWFLFCVLYFSVLFASGCHWNNGPLAFVRGCKNYGIDWNAFMAPIGAVVVLLVPLTIVYWIWRGFEVLFFYICFLLQLSSRAIKNRRFTHLL